MNYSSYIVKSKINKKNNILVNIPTFNGYDVTRKTIQTLLDKEKKTKVDILIVDNASDDYIKLSKDFPDINYCLLKENTGSSGAQRIGAEIALQYNYEYIVFSDNDALLLTDDGLSRMKNKCINDVVGVVPQNIELIPKNDFPKNSVSKLKGFSPLHYFLVRASILRETGLHNFFMFLSGDDASLSSKLLSHGVVMIDHDTLFYHPVFKPKNIQNKNTFLTIRSLLIMILFENKIKLKWKIRAFLFISFIFFQSVTHSIKFRDFSYLKTLFYIITSFKYGYSNMTKFMEILNKIPKNKFILQEVEGFSDKDKLKDLSGLRNSIFLPKKCFMYSNYLNKNIYYKLIRND